MRRNHNLTLAQRSSGILMHPTSLPAPHGIGDLGPSAFQFVDFLKKAGQRWWQMFPLGPLSMGNSPYQTLSAFAGNPLLISLELLEKNKWLKKTDIEPSSALKSDRVDYCAVTDYKLKQLKKAFANFETNAKPKEKAHFEAFCRKNKAWLLDFAHYNAIKDFHHGAPWWEWKPEFRYRKAPLANLKTEIRYHQFLQYLFHQQWTSLQTYAHQNHIGLIGDVPIFVALDSADVWAHPEIFHLDAKGNPTYVAGVPPDYFSQTGQLWGNPVYRWDVLKKQKYKWWIDRMRKALSDFDVVRLDHFIGFYRFWAVPYGAPTAQLGKWKKGPAADFFHALFRVLPKAQIIAEDLGLLTPEVEALRDQFGFPGMKVMQFSFETHEGAQVNRPHNFRKRCVVYTGTHDNNTTVGWFNQLSPNGSGERNFALTYLKSTGKEIHWDMIQGALSTVSDIVIIPIQDVLGLGEEARINQPGSPSGNWEWRLQKDALTKESQNRLSSLTKTYDREVF